MTMKIRLFVYLLLMHVSFGVDACINKTDNISCQLSGTEQLLFSDEKTMDSLIYEYDVLSESTHSVLKDIFPVLQEFPKNFEALGRLKTNELPCEVVSQYLLQTKNEVEYRLCLKNKYRAIGRIEYNSNVFLLYDMANGYEYEIYMSLCPRDNSYPLTLKIYKNMTGNSEITFSIEDGQIVLEEYGHWMEIPLLRNYVYKLDSNFSQIIPVYDRESELRYSGMD